MQLLLLLVARILYPFIQYYGVFFIALSLHSGTPVGSVAFLSTSLALVLTFFLGHFFILLYKLNLVAEECI